MPSSSPSSPALRPPVVVILGHVDHGKTSILDAIRKSRVAAREAGGITQHIGAYQAEYKEKVITFLDTPGHEAFSAIRSRGATVADIAVLVVAADEGIKPQTKEAIKIIKESRTPFVVAINKIDKEGSNPAKVRQELAEQEVLVEDYGGTVPVVELSARNGQGIDDLLEIILLVAEMEELKADSSGTATGVVIESHLDNRRGILATVLVREGTLEAGQWISAGDAFGKAKSLEDFTGKNTTSATPSQPCVVLGWEKIPRLGETFKVVASREAALEKAQASAPATILFAPQDLTNKKVANLIVKTDVQSSLEAVDQVLRTIRSEEVGYQVVGSGVGAITDADVKVASANKAHIVGFHVKIEESAKNLAEREHVTLRAYDIIYELVEGVRDILADLLEPKIRRTPLGRLKVLAVFGGEGKSQIVGGKVVQGKILRGAQVDVIRNNAVAFTGRLGQLQQSKADVPEVKEGMEAGIRFDSDQSGKIAVGDILDVYEEERIKRQL